MPTSLDISNMALVAIGQEAIMSFDDQHKSARLCKQLYEAAKRALLRAYPWTFAVRRVLLAREQEAPAFGFAHAYKLPSDCLRVVFLGTEGLSYTIEQNKVLTDASQVQLRYVQDITDAGIMDSQFAEVLALTLASQLVIPLTSDSELMQRLLELSKNKIALAVNTQAIEDSPAAVIEGDWIKSRI